MNDLCLELLLFLIGFLDQTSAVRLSTVSRLYRQLVLDTTKVTLRVTDRTTAEQICAMLSVWQMQPIITFSRMEVFHLRDVLPVLEGCDQFSFRVLRFEADSRSSATPSCLPFVDYLPFCAGSTRHLSITGYQAPGWDLEPLMSLTNHIRGSELQFVQLAKISFTRNPVRRPAQLSVLGDVLRSVHFTDCLELWRGAIAELARLPHLQDLFLANCPNYQHLNGLSESTSLQTLTLQENDIGGTLDLPRITENIISCVSLRSVTLIDTASHGDDAGRAFQAANSIQFMCEHVKELVVVCRWTHNLEKLVDERRTTVSRQGFCRVHDRTMLSKYASVFNFGWRHDLQLLICSERSLPEIDGKYRKFGCLRLPCDAENDYCFC